jgi:hypothetical protein
MGLAFGNELSVAQEETGVAQRLDRGHVVAYEHNRPAFTRNISHFSKTTFLKRLVANREYFVNQQDFGFKMRGDRKRQSYEHPTRVAFDGSIDESIDLGERNDLVELPRDLLSAHTKDCAAQEDIFPSGKLRMKPRSDFEKTPYPSIYLDSTTARLRNPRKNLEQGGLAGPVPTDDAEHLTALDVKGEIPQRPQIGFPTGGLVLLKRSVKPRTHTFNRAVDHLDERLTQSLISCLTLPERISF